MLVIKSTGSQDSLRRKVSLLHWTLCSQHKLMKKTGGGNKGWQINV